MLSKSTFAVLVTLVAVLSVGAASCGGGGSDREDYEETVVDTRNRVELAFASISEAQNRNDFTKRMEEASVAIDRAVDDLDEAEIAEGFEDETAKLTRALRQLADDLEATAEQMRLTPELFNARGLNFPGWTQANQVFASLDKQGIQVRPLGKH
jgi:hypothetical protein